MKYIFSNDRFKFVVQLVRKFDFDSNICTCKVVKVLTSPKSCPIREGQTLNVFAKYLSPFKDGNMVEINGRLFDKNKLKQLCCKS